MTTYGILAVELGNHRRHLGNVLCTSSGPDDILTYYNRKDATEQAASLTEWYQAEIRANVVYSAVPLPLY